MSRRGENIYLRKDKRWEGRYRIPSVPGEKPRYSSVYGHTYQEVKQKLIAKKAEYPVIPTESSILPTVEEVASLWLQYQLTHVKTSTYSTYQMILKQQILPEWGKKPLQKLSILQLDAFIYRKLTEGRRNKKGGLSPKYVRDILMIFKSLFRFAEERYETQLLPKRISLPQVRPCIDYGLTEEERLSLEHLALCSSEPRKLGILLCLYTGLRIGELCALRWSDFSASKDLLTISRTLQRIYAPDGIHTQVIQTSPKTRFSHRQIPLPQFLSQKLSIASQAFPKDAYFLTGATERFLEPRGYQAFFSRLLRREGFRPQIHFHLLRHTFATRCIQCGVDPKSLSEILGHSSVEITLNRYVHPTMEQKRQYLEALCPPWL